MRIEGGTVYKAVCNQNNSILKIVFMPVFSLGSNLVKQRKRIVSDFVFQALNTVPYILETLNKYIFESMNN